MSERYFITGVQLGCLIYPKLKEKSKALIAKKIIERQWIGTYSTEHEQKLFKKMMQALRGDKNGLCNRIKIDQAIEGVE